MSVVTPEKGPIYVDSKTVAVVGTPEALTTRNIRCRSVLIRPKSANTGDVYVCDSTTDTKLFPLAATGDSFPVENPAVILIDVEIAGEGVDWVAV